MNTLLRLALVLVGLLALAAVVWFATPFIAFGGVAPFDPIWVRLVIIGVIVLLVGGFYAFRWWRGRKAAEALEEGLVVPEEGVTDGQVLSERMTEALQTIKASTGRRNYLYVLPWYIIVGPPNAGKTTALLNSGIKFPLAEANGGAPLAGSGGTRYCDWWFTEEAVLIDTAGRYTTQDSDPGADRKSWLSFLGLLKKYRPKQPINGVIVAISLEDVMRLSPEELSAHATAIRKRLVEVHQELRVDFPVYMLFTKADLVAGFSDYFGNFTESRRRKVWGATFQTEDRRKNMVGQVPEQFDALTRRLTEELSDRMQEEPDPVSRIAIFGFPEQFALLKDRVSGLLREIFEPSRYQVNANLRGFYFSSGTQEGTPFDQVLGALDRAGGGASPGAGHMSGRGRSFFLHDLIKSVIFSETGWVSTDMGAMRLSAILRYGALTAAVVAALGLAGLWGWSYFSNTTLIANTDQFVSDYRVNANDLLTASSVSDSEVMSVLPALDMMRNNPVGYAHLGEGTPMGETFGLSQRDRLAASSEAAYRQALERTLRSRLILRVEAQLEASLNDPIQAYEALKVYMMLGGKAPVTDDDYIESWFSQDWEQNLYPGPNNKAARDALTQHLEAMLHLDDGKQPSFELNGLLIDSAQRTLTRLTLADQAYEYLKSLPPAVPIEDFNVADRSGPESALVFETVDGSDYAALTVPALFTYRGFHEHFLAELASIADQLASEQWVRGEVGQSMVTESEFQGLGPKLLALYSADFLANWNRVLDNIKLKALPGEKPDYIILSVASNKASSPIKTLVQAIAQETALTREAPAEQPADGNLDAALDQATALATQQITNRAGGLARIGINLALKGDGRPGDAPSAPQVPGANIEAQFKQYALLLDGAPPPIDLVLDSLNEIYRNLVVAAMTPSQAAQAIAATQLHVANLSMSASRLPGPFQRMVSAAVSDLEGDAAGSSLAQLNDKLAGTVTRLCEQLTSNLYPFASGSERDLPMADFARLFAPNGVMDRFFAENLLPLADMSGEVWTWKEDTALGRELSNSALREFQRAAQIRDAFFPPGASAPQVTLTISHASLHAAAQMALLDINGQVIQTQQTGNVPVTVQWPGSTGGGSVTLSIQPELQGRSSTYSDSRPWALMRLISQGAVTRSGDSLQVRFLLGGRDVSYNIQVGTIFNPFFLPALSEFSCPTGL
ncbi:type VI secretion system membrane subunit TssM [Devosia sp. Root635]|uniref:type VI secretion system membrane subunit TssM n=1 Tax=Devosia sp. Root635 TaxID=1736575 RepID=UPI0006F275D2|nr:type VI secretion system membrane subunit TssM [Devosia sp. Root635]KRA53069.1 type VI secretion protein [Devosia sp. Root635]